MINLNFIQIKERDVQPLGERDIMFRWMGRIKWVQVKVLEFLDSCFGDAPPFDIAFLAHCHKIRACICWTSSYCRL